MRGNRVIKIAQKKENKVISNILNHLGVIYRFKERERTYEITGKWNWDSLARINIASLHKEKSLKFWTAYNSFKEEHYPSLYLKEEIWRLLQKPMSSKELSKLVKRTHNRTSEVLSKLKKEGRINNFRIRSVDYWTKDKNVILISKIKETYLNILNNGRKRTYEIAKELKITHKSAKRRLSELNRLGLVSPDKDKLWRLNKVKQKVVII